MCQLIETIKCESGKLFNLDYHNKRLNQARYELFGIERKIDLRNLIQVPEEYNEGLFRCRVIYSTKIHKVEFLPHHYRKIKSLKLVESNDIDYHLKYSDRSSLQCLFDKREDCDDILIVKKDCITDSFTANPIFFDGKKWWTPEKPLLKGTQRERLLFEKKIYSCRICVNDLTRYEKIGLINAFQNMENMPVILSKCIKY